MRRLRRAWGVMTHLGPGFVLRRVGIAVDKRLGLTRRRFAPRAWESIRLENITKPGTPTDPAAYASFRRTRPPAFLFPLGQPPAPPVGLRDGGTRRPPLDERIALLREGRCVYLFDQPSRLPVLDFWNRNGLTGQTAPADLTWCDIPDFSATQGDARVMWDPGRAAWAIDLARGGDACADAAALYWQWVESWLRASPPFRGFHWKCGQESSVRLIALAIGLWALSDRPEATPRRWCDFARLAWATGYRVRHHISYAVSQKNNHALSEACGLILVATLFPEFRESAAWERVGRDVLAREMRRQIYADGSYVQHSMNYERVMLQVCALALRLCELSGRPLPRDLYERLGRSAEFLHQVMDPQTGRLPNYGNNDSALVLPLSECEFADFRPAVQAAHALVHRRRLYAPGPWDEEALWLLGAESLDGAPREVPRCSTAFDAGGYYTLRQRESWAMIRCHTYRDRPAHCDPLHVDLWWRGCNVLADGGTGLYYAPEAPAVERYFKSIAAHNTVEIDGRDPLELVSRFLWIPWPRARVLRFEPGGAPSRFEGEHLAYDRAPWHVRHRRTLMALGDDRWLVIDDLLGGGTHALTLRWRMEDAPLAAIPHGAGGRAPCDFEQALPAGSLSISLRSTGRPLEVRVERGTSPDGEPLGLAAPSYGRWQPAPVLAARWRGTLPVRLVTLIAPGGASTLEPLAADGRQWQVHGDRSQVITI